MSRAYIYLNYCVYLYCVYQSSRLGLGKESGRTGKTEYISTCRFVEIGLMKRSFFEAKRRSELDDGALKPRWLGRKRPLCDGCRETRILELTPHFRASKSSTELASTKDFNASGRH